VAVEVTDTLGIKGTIRFMRPDIVGVWVRVTITITPRYDAESGITIARNLAAWSDSLKIGEPILINRMYAPIFAGDTSAYAPTYNVSLLEVSTDAGEAWSGGNISIAFNELARIQKDNVIVVIEGGE
jgi:hypothetical protein